MQMSPELHMRLYIMLPTYAHFYGQMIKVSRSHLLTSQMPNK